VAIGSNAVIQKNSSLAIAIGTHSNADQAGAVALGAGSDTKTNATAASDITVKDGKVGIRDFGRGIPLGKVVDVVSKMNTGGKYDSEAFKKSIDLMLCLGKMQFFISSPILKPFIGIKIYLYFKIYSQPC